MKRKMKLQTKLTIWISIVVFISILTISIFVASWTNKDIENTAKTNVMNVAKIIASSDFIINELKNKDEDKGIGPYIDKQLSKLKEIEYIIVVDNKGIRHSHPDYNKIGKKFVGGDEGRVIKEGDTYISQATGTLGKSLRAFVPIYDPTTKKEIGFVCVGTLLQSIGQMKHVAILYIIGISSCAFIIGIFLAFLLARNIKNTLLGLEPEEIARLYNEKIGILDAIYEGLVAIDKDGKITMINDSAVKILHCDENISKNDIIGNYIEDYLPNTRLLNVIESGKVEYEKEQRINNTIIMSNRIPIKDKDKIVGAIATFRDKTELTKLAEELTGVKKMAWSLRAQNHEFMNKLHTIGGLIQLEEYDEALEFISDIATNRNKISSILTKNIKDSYLSAILFSKYNKAEENRVKFKIDENSNLANLPQNMTSEEIVSIVGNLIENSLDAVSNEGDGEIYIKIEQNDSYLKICVKDNGIGIKKEHIDRIYEQGFTTKEGDRGHGMAIVKEIVDNSKGNIKLHVDKGVTWHITIPMLRR